MMAMRKTSTRVGVAVILVGLVALRQWQDNPEEGGSEMGDSGSGSTVAAHTNRLAKETSPYLLQHAHNPVDWYPWGTEALELARRENKIIFLSIGYSACHWCHVMERESFEDPETAAILNAHFVAIKVDREERPDLDEIYMTAVQMMTGGGGWPLSVFLTPELKPFYGGTYFPPEDRHGMPGFKRVLTALADLWREKPEDVARDAENVVRALQAQVTPSLSRAGGLDKSVFVQAAAELRSTFDPAWGGFGSAPKFPPCAAIALLLRQHRQSGEKDLLDMATVTLDRMALGGLYDQIGGGFHRYSTDAQWLVPHFEKMLYDNALLTQVYLEAWQATRKTLYRRIATETLDYVLRDMTDAHGGFHSAEDADSEGQEGKFYVWRPGEIRAVLGEEDGTLFCGYYGVSNAGNFEGENILHVPNDISEFARRRQVSAGDLEKRLAPLRQKLREVRERRVRPGKDDKVLSAWNGMMISALARGYQVLGEDRFLKAAQRAADFVLTTMMRDGLLLRSYRSGSGKEQEGQAKLPAYLDDYAQMANALVDLYEATFDLRWLSAADELSQKMVADFWDAKDAGFFYTSAAHKNLLVRTKPYYDGVVPSGNAAAAFVLLRLAKLLDNADYAGQAGAVLSGLQESLHAQPRAHLNLLCAADFHLRPTREIAIAGKPASDAAKRFLQVIHARFIPNKVLACLEPGAPDAGATMIGGKTTVYVCEHFVCKRPVVDAAELAKILDTVR